MIVHQVFAHIVGQEVKNVIVCDNYEMANQLSRTIYGAEAIAVDCTQFPLSPGDKYINYNYYFKDGVTRIPKMNTAEEDAKEAQAKAEILSKQQAEIAVDTDYRLSLLELGLVSV